MHGSCKWRYRPGPELEREEAKQCSYRDLWVTAPRVYRALDL